VRVVAIDICTVFRSAVDASLPHATLVVDRFHVAQPADAAVAAVRRRVTLQQQGRRGRQGQLRVGTQEPADPLGRPDTRRPLGPDGH